MAIGLQDRRHPRRGNPIVIIFPSKSVKNDILFVI